MADVYLQPEEIWGEDALVPLAEELKERLGLDVAVGTPTESRWIELTESVYGEAAGAILWILLAAAAGQLGKRSADELFDAAKEWAGRRRSRKEKAPSTAVLLGPDGDEIDRRSLR